MKIPVETGGGKLAPHSIKCMLIEYFDCDAYCLLDKTTGKLFHSQDVIFEEGIGHCTLGTEPVSIKKEIDHIILQLANDPIPNLGLIPTHITTEDITPPQPAIPAAQPLT